MSKIRLSCLINTLNEEHNLKRCLESLNFVDEIVVVDMESSDKTVEIAKEYTHLVYSHQKTGYVEPARNFGLSKCSGDWILIVDADEVIPHTLATKLLELAQQTTFSYFRLPRSNNIFNKALKHTGWWPDYNIRFFKKGSVVWQDAIHSVPITSGLGEDLQPQEELAIKHFHYRSLDEYLTRMLRYTKQQADELIKDGYQYTHFDVISKPFSEFISRFFGAQGYKDGFHGLVLSLLQAFSTFVVYLRLWEKEGFTSQDDIIQNKAWLKLFNDKFKEFLYWLTTIKIHLSESKLQKTWYKLRRKLSL